MLVAKNLRKRFGERTAVDGVSFEIEGGEIYGLLGPNGAGKTTTIGLLSGILVRDEGQVTIDGIDLDEGAPARARLGLVPQDILLYFDLTARENLRFWGRLYDLRGPALDRAVDEALETVGLRDRADDRVGDFSGGMKRRLNLAAGVLHDPAVLILDEPTVGVDPQSRSALFERIEAFRERGMAVLYTTHYMEEARRLCDRVAIVDAGRIVAEGTAESLIASIGAETRIELGFSRPEEAQRAAEGIAKLTGVSRCDVDGCEARVFVDGGIRRMAALWECLAELGCFASRLELREPDLEDVFLELTGRELRD